MPDLLVPLYRLPKRQSMPVSAIYTIRRAVHWEKHLLTEWVNTHFDRSWASETDVTFSRQPVSCFVALKDNKFVGFSCYEVARRGFLRPDRGPGF